MTSIGNDRGGVIVGYFTKIAAVIAVFAIVSFDAVSVGVTRMNAQDTASEAAQAGAESWLQDHNSRLAFQAAEAYAEEHDAVLDPKGFSIDHDGTVHVRMEKDATTVLLYRTAKTKTWAHVVVTGSGKAI